MQINKIKCEKSSNCLCKTKNKNEQATAVRNKTRKEEYINNA